MPHESDDIKLTPELIDSAMFAFHDEKSFRELAQADAAAVEDAEIEESLASTDRLLQMSKELSDERAVQEAEKPGPIFEIPKRAQAILDASREDYDQVWETEAAKSTPRTQGQLRSELEKAGARREPPAADEVESQEQERLAVLRAEAALRVVNHSSKTFKTRTSSSKVLWRPKGSIQRDIASNDPKVKETYKETDQLQL